LLPLLEDDADLARAFLGRLRIGFFAAAALPQALWDRLEALNTAHGGTMRMTTSWGLTETAPAATSAHFSITRSEAVNGAQLITGYVVLEGAVTPASPQGRPDVFSSLQLEISHLRQFDDYVPRPLSVGAPTLGQLCAEDKNAVCAPLG
jgi:acyl-CoA synthetase (AMP-forming)/AMP-acid ligase II